MQHHDEDGLRNRPLHELLNEDDDVERPYQPQASFSDFNIEINNNNNNNDNNKDRGAAMGRLVKLCAIGIAVVLVVGGAIAMIALAPAKRYGSMDPQQLIVGDSADSRTIKSEASGTLERCND